MRIIRLPDVEAKTGLGRSTIYALIKQGRFPAQIKLSERASGWIESEIEDYLKQKVNIARSNHAAGPQPLAA